MAETPSQATIEHDGFTIDSTSTSADDLRTELESKDSDQQEQRSEQDDKAAADSGPSPRKTDADESKPKQEPQPSRDGKPAKDVAPQKPADQAAIDAAKLPKGSPERRVAELKAEINALTRDKHTVRGETEAAKAEREAIAAEIAALKREKESLEAETKKGKAEPDTKGEKVDDKAAAIAARRKEEPKEDDFEDFRDYIKAHGQWIRSEAALDAEERALQTVASRQEEETRARTEAERRQQEQAFIAQRKELAEKHSQRIAAYEVAHPEFPAIMKAAGSLPTNPWMDEHILHSETGPQLMRFFAENPEECERIAALGPGPTLVEIGKIEATKLVGSAKSGSEPAERRSTTKAHPPVSPVKGTSEVAADDDGEDLSNMEFGPEYVNRMNARDRERNRRRL